ncbi:hypothetical protein F5884DRAFT_17066 [Xylogone sp. PMI_703]|nr:hypothetical protein F5884DRAFT_17066 [Xylogone sp. PMI_703]
MAALALPAMAPFPRAVWRIHITADEWKACLSAWLSLVQSHLSLRDPEFIEISTKDESLTNFLRSFNTEMATSYDELSAIDLHGFKKLKEEAFMLCARLQGLQSTPSILLQWQFLADLSRNYGKHRVSKLLKIIWNRHSASIEASLSLIKVSLIKQLYAGSDSNLKSVEADLRQLNYLIYVSPDAAALFMAGTDFLDGLINCYQIVDSLFRKIIVSTTYLCLIGLTEGAKSNISSLVDQLYFLKAAAEKRNKDTGNNDHSLVTELVTSSPILAQLRRRVGGTSPGSSRVDAVLSGLEPFCKSGGLRSHRPTRNLAKGKGHATADVVEDYDSTKYTHIHRMSQVSQLQDLFPHLGSAFIIKLLDEYSDDVEKVTAHVLDGTLPEHLKHADQSESFEYRDENTTADAIHQTIRRNVFDDDELDRLAVTTSQLHFGRQAQSTTADDLLRDRSSAPRAAAILSALAAFDSDDDERDDTYDVEDVGGTVDSAAPGNNSEEQVYDGGDSSERLLFETYKANPSIFHRDAATRRRPSRASLKEQTGLTDEAIEGWALMLNRDQRRMHRLEAKYSTFSGDQPELVATSWRPNPSGSGTEDSDADGIGRGRGGFNTGRSRGRGQRGRGRGNVTGPVGDKSTEVARHRKEVNKGSRANHNRRDQRAKKMARGGFSAE